MRFISLFSGIGGFDLGFERAGMTCVAQVEIDDFCNKVLSKHWPDVPRYKDVMDVGKHNLPTAGLICGGFPCQDVSTVGQRKGLKGKRSTLWSEFHRIICEVQPRWVVIENVSGLLSSDNGEFARKIFRELTQAGFDAEWISLYASDFGAPHRRERIFIVANSNGFRLEKNTSYKSVFTEAPNNNLPRYFEPTLGTDLVSDFPTRETLVSQPEYVGTYYGLSERLDKPRIKALGNAVVPQVAEWIGRRIMEIDQS